MTRRWRNLPADFRARLPEVLSPERRWELVEGRSFGDASEGRLARMRAGAWPLAQIAAAAALGWLPGGEGPWNPDAYFAPLAAIVALAATRGQRVRQAIEMTLGVAVGIGVGDLVVRAIGIGIWQLALIVALALAAALILGPGRMLSTEAAVSAALVATVSPQTQGFPPTRFLDALLGGAVALVFSQLLFPVHPVEGRPRDARVDPREARRHPRRRRGQPRAPRSRCCPRDAASRARDRRRLERSRARPRRGTGGRSLLADRAPDPRPLRGRPGRRPPARPYGARCPHARAWRRPGADNRRNCPGGHTCSDSGSCLWRPRARRGVRGWRRRGRGPGGGTARHPPCHGGPPDAGRAVDEPARGPGAGDLRGHAAEARARSGTGARDGWGGGGKRGWRRLGREWIGTCLVNYVWRERRAASTATSCGSTARSRRRPQRQPLQLREPGSARPSVEPASRPAAPAQATSGEPSRRPRPPSPSPPPASHAAVACAR